MFIGCTNHQRALLDDSFNSISFLCITDNAAHFREKGGYNQHFATFYPASSSLDPLKVTLYLGSQDNWQYAGPAPLQEMATTILKSVGPSGENKEYLYLLADTMRKIAPDHNDEHLYELEKAVKDLELQSSSRSPREK